MNAHHKKSTYRPPPPLQRARFSSGSAQPSNRQSAAEDRSRHLARLKKAIQKVPFGWQLDIILPSSASSSSIQVEEEIRDAVNPPCVSYFCEGVNLADLLEPSFLNSFVRTGSLTALSLDDSEGEDVVAIDGRGRLLLSVSKDTYELLGLPGRASAFGTLRQRFFIEIPLTDPSFRAGKPGFERTKSALRNWPRQTDLLDEYRGHGAPRGQGKTFDLMMAFTDTQGKPQPLSLPGSLRAVRIPPTLDISKPQAIRIPRVDAFPAPNAAPLKKQRTSSGAFRAPARAPDDPSLFWESYREWAGLVIVGATDKLQAGADVDDVVDDTWGLERDQCQVGEVTVLSWSGLLHPQALSSALHTVWTSPSLASIPFLNVSLRPFAHAPISHLSALSPPVVGTSKRPNGKKRKRGRGRGEEEEADRERAEAEGGWDCVLRPAAAGDGGLEWHLWEGQ